MTVDALIVGGRGTVARCLAWELARRHRTVVSLDRAACDVTDAAAVHDAVATHRPRWVFNGAAWNAVDGAESEPGAAWAANALAPGFACIAARTASTSTGSSNWSTTS